MADNGRIEEKDIIDDKVYQIGEKVNKSLDPATKGIDELKSFQTNQSSNDKINEKAIEDAIARGFEKQKVHFHTTNHNHNKVDIGHELWKLKQLNRE